VNLKNRKDTLFLIVAVGILSMAILCMCFCGRANAEMCTYSFPESDAQRIVVVTEQLQWCEGYATSLNFVIAEQDEKIALLEQLSDRLEKANNANLQAIDGLKKVNSLKDEQAKLLERQHQKELKESKRTGFIWGTATGVIGTFGMILLVILL